MPFLFLDFILELNTTMNNIFQDPIKSKLFNLIFARFQKSLVKRNIAEVFTDDNDNNFLRLKDPTGQGYDEKCPFHIPLAFKENPHKKPKKRSKNKDVSKKYEDLYICVEGGKVPEKILKEALLILLNGLPVMIKKENGKVTAFEANANGTKRKAIQDQIKIQEHARRAKILAPYTYFLTLTERVRPGEQNIIEQYKHFGNEQSKFLQKMVKRYGCYYEVVSEATYNGYRHAHIVIHTKTPMKIEKVVKAKNSATVYGGEFREWIKKNWILGTSKLEISDKRSPINYLLKYITKFAYSDMRKQATKKEKLTKDEKKAMQTLLFPILSGTRRYNLSQFTIEEIEATTEAVTFQRNIASKKIHFTLATQTAPKCVITAPTSNASSLDIPSINSEIPCLGKVRVLAYKKFIERSNCEIEDFDKLEQVIKESIWDSATSLGCEGCALSHLIHEKLFHNDPWFHKDEIKPVEYLEPYHTPEEYEKRKEMGKFFVFGGREVKTFKTIRETTFLTLEEWLTPAVSAPVQKASVLDYYAFTDEEEEERAELLKKYDERILPFVLPPEKMNLTIYKKPLQPPLKVTFSPEEYATIDEYGTLGDMKKGTYAAKIHKYLLNPRASSFYENSHQERTEEIKREEDIEIFGAMEISKEDYDSFMKKEVEKTTQGKYFLDS